MGVPLLAGLVGAVVANVEPSVVPSPPGETGSTLAAFAGRLVGAPAVAGVDTVAVVATLLLAAASFQFVRRRTQASVDRGVRTFLVLLGSVVAFSSGGSQLGLATGPLKNLYGAELGLPRIALLAIGAVGILGGAWMGSQRLLQTI